MAPLLILLHYLRNGYCDDEIKQVDRDTRVCLYALLPDNCKRDINWRLLSLTIDRLSLIDYRRKRLTKTLVFSAIFARLCAYQSESLEDSGDKVSRVSSSSTYFSLALLENPPALMVQSYSRISCARSFPNTSSSSRVLPFPLSLSGGLISC